MDALNQFLDWLSGQVPVIKNALAVIGSLVLVLFVVAKSRLKNVPALNFLVRLLARYSPLSLKEPPEDKK